MMVLEFPTKHRSHAMTQHTAQACYTIATSGARTAQGGTVATGDPRVMLEGHAIACVGDRVTYPDGRDAHIVSGSRHLFVAQRAVAAVGSRLDNGDVLVASLQSGGVLCDSEEYGPALDHDVAAFAAERA